jgi:hypothetical protein
MSESKEFGFHSVIVHDKLRDTLTIPQVTLRELQIRQLRK